MAADFGKLSDVIKKIYSEKFLQEAMKKDADLLRKLKQGIQIQQPQRNIIMPLPEKKPLTGRKFVQVQTPDGPQVYDYVTEVNYLDNGGLEITSVHEGNVTIECFPAGHWTHCTCKELAPEQITASAARMGDLMGKLSDDGIDALAQQFYGMGNRK